MLPGAAVKTNLARICVASTSCGFGAVRVSSAVSTEPLLRISLPRLMLAKSDPWSRSVPAASERLVLNSSARPSQVVLAPRWNRRLRR